MLFRKRVIAAIFILTLAVLFAGCSSSPGADEALSPNKEVSLQGIRMVLFQPPTWSCCEAWSGYMTEQGLQVEINYVEDMTSITDKYLIPENMQSCHTAIIEGYFVEGHIPVEVIEKLLIEKPDIDGIALPEMPSGSPGMSGNMTESLQIYALSEGTAFEFVIITKL